MCSRLSFCYKFFFYITNLSFFPQSDADNFLQIFKKVNDASKAKVEDFSEDVLYEFAYTAQGNLCPMQAFIGGVTAQEVMKVGSWSFYNRLPRKFRHLLQDHLLRLAYTAFFRIY